MEDEDDLSLTRVSYGSVGTSFEPGDNVVVNAFYINKALREIMGNKAHVVACNATVGSHIDDRHVASVRLGVTSYGSALVAATSAPVIATKL